MNSFFQKYVKFFPRGNYLHLLISPLKIYGVSILL